MRFYSVIRFNTYKIRYAEIVNSHYERHTPFNTFKVGSEIISIPSTTSKIYDPFLLWKQTIHREPFRIMEIQDKNGQTWFKTKSTFPLSKIMEVSSNVLKNM